MLPSYTSLKPEMKILKSMLICVMTNHVFLLFNCCLLIFWDIWLLLPLLTKIFIKIVFTLSIFTNWLKSLKEESLSILILSPNLLKTCIWTLTLNLQLKTLEKSMKPSAQTFYCYHWEKESLKVVNFCITKFTVKFMRVYQ